MKQYALQCSTYSDRAILKGYKRKSYAPTKTRINPMVINVYVPNESGELVLSKRVRPKSK